jgi:hypothetical protein
LKGLKTEHFAYQLLKHKKKNYVCCVWPVHLEHTGGKQKTKTPTWNSYRKLVNAMNTNPIIRDQIDVFLSGGDYNGDYTKICGMIKQYESNRLALALHNQVTTPKGRKIDNAFVILGNRLCQTHLSISHAHVREVDPNKDGTPDEADHHSFVFTADICSAKWTRVSEVETPPNLEIKILRETSMLVKCSPTKKTVKKITEETTNKYRIYEALVPEFKKLSIKKIVLEDQLDDYDEPQSSVASAI